jgi:hypothetical protein
VMNWRNMPHLSDAVVAFVLARNHVRFAPEAVIPFRLSLMPRGAVSRTFFRDSAMAFNWTSDERSVA